MRNPTRRQQPPLSGGAGACRAACLAARRTRYACLMMRRPTVRQLRLRPERATPRAATPLRATPYGLRQDRLRPKRATPSAATLRLALSGETVRANERRAEPMLELHYQPSFAFRLPRSFPRPARCIYRMPPQTARVARSSASGCGNDVGAGPGGSSARSARYADGHPVLLSTLVRIGPAPLVRVGL